MRPDEVERTEHPPTGKKTSCWRVKKCPTHGYRNRDKNACDNLALLAFAMLGTLNVSTRPLHLQYKAELNHPAHVAT